MSSSSASSSSSPSDPPPPRRSSSSTSPVADPAPPSRLESKSFSRDREAVITPVKGEKQLTWKEIQARNVVSKFQDPCAHASDQARLCMNLYDHDKDACSAYFQAYRDCKDEWAKKRTH